jgi:hypothetical protein
MNDPESFLPRWSRRKRAAALETEGTLSSDASSSAVSEEAVASARTVEAERPTADGVIMPGISAAQSPFNPLSVPAIESITADTDIRGFLAPGVPPELTRAALRRAWAADPKIRDFVGLADYDWDFNAPGSMAGFGPLEMTDELRRMAAQIVGPAPTRTQAAEMANPAPAKLPTDRASAAPATTAAQPPGREDDHAAPAARNTPPGKPAEPCNQNEFGRPDQAIGPAQCQPRDSENSQLIVYHRHGGALPK